MLLVMMMMQPLASTVFTWLCAMGLPSGPLVSVRTDPVILPALISWRNTES